MQTELDLIQNYLKESREIHSASGLLFIPDISGFTEFVSNICIEAGRFIICELLNTIISSNILQLQISEVEGDAVLFYKFCSLPNVQDIIYQYEVMLDQFNIKLKVIENVVGKKFNLSLKLIVHYGKFSEYRIGSFRKLYGEAVVKAHLMLKNDIESNTYILMSKPVDKIIKSSSDEYVMYDYQNYCYK